MPETADMQLLDEFAGKRSEAAFAELVRRHVNLVYSVALRQTGNAHHAEEIAQAVFIILARKADSLSRQTVLSGWLYQTARLTTANFLRTERRQAAREQEAYMQSLTNEPGPEVWRQIAPLLDDAVAKLGEQDQNAIVLRFFEGKSLGEVGAALGASEDAAKMRVNRALEKLRRIFLRRGVALSTASIAGAISANSISAAPAALAASTIVLAGGSAVAAASTLTLVKGALGLMTISKLQFGAVSALIVAGLATPLVLEHRANAKLREENLALRQQHPQPAVNVPAHSSAAPAPEAGELERLRKEHAELLKLRGEIGRLRGVEQELARLRAAAQATARNSSPAPSTAAAQELPKDSWSDAGFATPAAALQTRGWAVLNANRERFKESLHITDAAKKLLDAMVEGMITASPDPAKAREQIRQQGLTKEDGLLFPMIAENQQKGYAGYRVLSQQAPSADETVLELETQMASGSAKKEAVKMQRFEGAWKVVIDEAFIETQMRELKK